MENLDNKDVVMLPPARFLSKIVIESGLECLLLDQMSSLPVPNGVRIENGLWMDRGCVFVPEQLRTKIIELHHDSPLAGHLGQKTTKQSVGHHFVWPGMNAEVQDYVCRCEQCAQNKGVAPPAGMLPLPVPDGPWQDISLDFVIELPEHNEKNTVCVIVNQFSKEVSLTPMTTQCNSKELVSIL